MTLYTPILKKKPSTNCGFTFNQIGTPGLDVRIKTVHTIQNFYASYLNLSTKLHIIELRAAAKAELYIFFLKEGRMVLTELYIMES